MKYIVASDIHGSVTFLEQLLKRFEKEQADKLILLGDLYYHGPRNPLPEGYNPMEVAKTLNKVKEYIYVIKGNCDAEVDEMISEFTFNQGLELTINNKNIYFTHGHKYNEDNIKENTDILIFGHFHTGFIKEKNNQIFINVGSITLPKNNTAHSYLVIDNNNLILKDLEGNLIDSIKI